MLKIFHFHLIYCQIWLNLPMDDHHFGYIIKLTKTNISDDVPTLFTITHLFYYPTFVGL
jgi:hypothetical protein